jgi:hypothetical protein
MHLLIWQRYGEAVTFLAETPTQLFHIAETLRKAVEGWGLQREINELYNQCGRTRSVERVRQLLMNFASPHIGTHEAFEQFKFTELQM